MFVEFVSEFKKFSILVLFVQGLRARQLDLPGPINFRVISQLGPPSNFRSFSIEDFPEGEQFRFLPSCKRKVVYY